MNKDMVALVEMWFEDFGINIHGEPVSAIRLDWSNGRHQRIVIHDKTPEGVLRSIDELAYLLRKEIAQGKLFNPANPPSVPPEC